MKLINIYIIDDHELISSGFITLFTETRGFKITGSSLNVEDALSKINPTEVDVIILDLIIPCADPIVNIKTLKNNFSTLPIVILSAENSLYWQIETFRAGVKAYMFKGEALLSMTAKLKSVAEGEVVIPQMVAERIIQNKFLTLDLDDSQEIMKGLSEGQSIPEIAIKKNCSTSLIQKKLVDLREYYGVKTNYQLLYYYFIRLMPFKQEQLVVARVDMPLVLWVII